MASSPFERQVVESDSADDRSSVSTRMSDGPQQYPPSPSFLDHDRPAVRLVELPAWLQSFASSVGEPSEEEFPAASTGPPLEEPVPSPKDSDDILNQMESDPPASTSTSRDVSSDFISEDDLPEWLRSIAPKDSPDSSIESVSAERSPEGDHPAVPNVTRAWSTSKDARGVDEATSLFALVASQTPQHALPEQEVGPAQGRARSGAARRVPDDIGENGSSRSPGEGDLAAGSDVAAEDGSASAAASRLPMLPIVAAAILLLVLLGAAAVLFIL